MDAVMGASSTPLKRQRWKGSMSAEDAAVMSSVQGPQPKASHGCHHRYDGAGVARGLVGRVVERGPAWRELPWCMQRDAMTAAAKATPTEAQTHPMQGQVVSLPSYSGGGAVVTGATLEVLTPNFGCLPSSTGMEPQELVGHEAALLLHPVAAMPVLKPKLQGRQVGLQQHSICGMRLR
mmetsp:Transcript_61548/g.170655  ORF Transcript_61548/g.170655 Transcript_61548/m.170655 type:complete len:179 (-) Transcript_61548:144-680(-)